MTTSRNDPTCNEFADMMTNKRDGGQVEHIVQLLVETTPDEPTCLLAAAMLRAQQRALAESRAYVREADRRVSEFNDAALSAIARATKAEARAERLAGALRELVRINEEHNAACEAAIGKPLGWKDDYLNAARAALEQEPTS